MQPRNLTLSTQGHLLAARCSQPYWEAKSGSKTSSLCCTQFSLTLWDGIRAKFCMVKGGSSVAEMKFVANKSPQCVQPYVQPGNGSVPLSYYQISGKVCEIERSLSALFIGLFPPFSFLVEYKEEMKDGLSEVITGIK